jgi:hypothetical protein
MMLIGRFWRLLLDMPFGPAVVHVYVFIYVTASERNDFVRLFRVTLESRHAAAR